MIEENKLPGGGSSVRETTYRSDVNGSLQEVERQTTETRVDGSTTTANTVIDRPTLNGSLKPSRNGRPSRKARLTTSTPPNRSTGATASGGFQEALRTVKTTVQGRRHHEGNHGRL